MSDDPEAPYANDKKPRRPPLRLGKLRHGMCWGWFALESHGGDLWIPASYGGGAFAIGDFYEIDREQSDAEAVADALQQVEDEKNAAKELGGAPWLPSWELY